MELKITNSSNRLVLERTDNGAIMYEVSEENAVSSKFVYEIYYPNGRINFESMSTMISDIVELMKIPSEDSHSNAKLSLVISKIDESKD